MRTRSLTLLIGLAVLAGCTSTSEGTPRPTTDDTAENTPPSSSEEPDGDELPFAGAPEVTDPLDTDRFQQDPCQALTATQAQELAVTFPGGPYDGALGKACEWKSPTDRLAAVDVRFLSDDPRGLSALYLANESGGYVYFDELAPIEGYPAVARDGVDDRDIGKCTVVTGTSDEDAFEVVLRLSQANVGEKDPCETAALVAEMALSTMKENP